jgi:AcrR family transcriptional regulator
MKDRIIGTTIQEMNERSIKFTVDAVANRLGISKKTVYQYYPSKDALIGVVIDAILADIEMQKQDILVNYHDLAGQLTAILTIEPRLVGKLSPLVFDDIRRAYPKEWEKIQCCHRAQLAVIEDLLNRGVQTGSMTPIHCKVALRMLQGAVHALVDQGFLQEYNLTFQETLATVTRVFLYGILVSPNLYDGGTA